MAFGSVEHHLYIQSCYIHAAPVEDLSSIHFLYNQSFNKFIHLFIILLRPLPSVMFMYIYTPVCHKYV